MFSEGVGVARAVAGRIPGGVLAMAQRRGGAEAVAGRIIGEAPSLTPCVDQGARVARGVHHLPGR